ncbi:brain and acute leukemia cytoplasmic protein isoform X7 [Canis lupus baileyi]|uniref:brain and acute leukemia cytoplasmic protein isoform X7 n=1 Tax=Canis lupus baileyi TaxID=143281 RepID=UPI003B977518
MNCFSTLIHCSQFLLLVAGNPDRCSICVLEDGLSSNGIPRSAAPGGISNPEKKMSCGTQCPNPQSLTSGPLTQKQNGLRTMEAKRDAKRMSAKEVTINVTESIRQVDRNRRMAKNCVN